MHVPVTGVPVTSQRLSIGQGAAHRADEHELCPSANASAGPGAHVGPGLKIQVHFAALLHSLLPTTCIL